MTSQEWIITVDDEHLSQIDDVVDALEASGLAVDQVLRSLGQITGHTEEGKELDPASLGAVAGVASADGAQRHSIAPPEAEVQ